MPYRSYFPFHHSEQKITYLDHAATSQKPKATIDALTEYYTHFNSNAHRSTHNLGRKSTQIIEECRTLIQEYTQSNQYYDCIFTSGCTQSLNLAAHFLSENLKADDIILIGSWDHHSNIIPWIEICKQKNAILIPIPLNSNQTPDLDWFYHQIQNPKVKGAVWSHTSNVLGFTCESQKMCSSLNQNQQFSIIDIAQSVSSIQIEADLWQASALAFSAHKMYGPLGLGVLLLNNTLSQTLKPIHFGGGAVFTVEWNKISYTESPWKHEVGTQNIAALYSFHHTLLWLKQLGFEKINTYLLQLQQFCNMENSKRPWLKIWSNPNSHSLLSWNIENIQSYDLGVFLDETNIALRTGKHCAGPLLNSLSVDSLLRISWGINNNINDLKYFYSQLDQAYDILK